MFQRRKGFDHFKFEWCARIGAGSRDKILKGIANLLRGGYGLGDRVLRVTGHAAPPSMQAPSLGSSR